MPAIKYIFLFCWGVVLLTMILFIIRQHSFIRRKKQGTLNLSETVYAISLLISGALLLASVLQTLATAYDIVQKFYNGKVLTLLTSCSLISVSGIFAFTLLFIASRVLATLIYFNRKPLIEFAADNIAYALFRAGLLIAVTILFLPIFGPVFQTLLPSIATPFYR